MGRRAVTVVRDEVAAHGLRAFGFHVVGALEIVAGLMVGAIAMHTRVKGPARRYVPAALLLAMCVGIVRLPLVAGIVRTSTICAAGRRLRRVPPCSGLPGPMTMRRQSWARLLDWFG